MTTNTTTSSSGGSTNPSVVASIACRYPKLTRALVGTCIVCSSPFTLPLLLLSSPALLLLLSLSCLLSSPPCSSFACHLNSNTPRLLLCYLYKHATKHLFFLHDNHHHHNLNTLVTFPHLHPSKLNTHTYAPTTSSTSRICSSPCLGLHHEDCLPCSFLYKVVVYHPYGGGDDEESVPDFMSQLDYVWRHVGKQGFPTFHPHGDGGRVGDDGGDILGQGQGQGHRHSHDDDCHGLDDVC